MSNPGLTLAGVSLSIAGLMFVILWFDKHR